MAQTEFNLKEKHILITGGGSGLGLDMAGRFAESGATVSICGRNADKLDQAREKILRRSENEQVFTCPADVRNFEEVEEMITALEKQGGLITGLVNNAAGNFLAASEDISPNGFKSVVDIVLTGSFNCTRLVGKRLIDEKTPGSILNIVTTYTQTGCAFVLPSACAKAGVEAMTNSLAYEWGTYGIRVNAIAPGPFPTEGAWTRLMPDPKMEEVYKSRIPTGRYGEQWELSNLAAFMMSDLSPYMTGATIPIDGGERLNSGQFNFIAQMAPREELKNVFEQMKKQK